MNLVWKTAGWKKGTKYHLNLNGGEKLNFFGFITSWKGAVVAEKEGNQSVISDVIEVETASSLINVHRSIFPNPVEGL